MITCSLYMQAWYAKWVSFHYLVNSDTTNVNVYNIWLPYSWRVESIIFNFTQISKLLIFAGVCHVCSWDTYDRFGHDMFWGYHCCKLLCDWLHGAPSKALCFHDCRKCVQCRTLHSTPVVETETWWPSHVLRHRCLYGCVWRYLADTDSQ